jgi:hypothetical protein
MKISAVCTGAAIAIVAASLPGKYAFAAEKTYRSDYSISVMGLTVGKSRFTTVVNESGFTMKGRLSTSGVARLFDKTDGEAEVTGRLAEAGPEPGSYRIDYPNGKRPKHTRIDFSGGVARAENEPPLRKKREWIDVSEDDLKTVADPLTALLIQASDPQSVCRRTLRVFDGATRVDLELTYAGRQRFSATGFEGEATTCKVRFIPVSGYNKGRDSIAFLRDKSQIRVSFASLGDSSIYAPVYATVGTQIGNVTIFATRFEKTSE